MGVQVYEATHNGEGIALSMIDKQFISFSYGGKNIEDFGWVRITSGDRIQRAISAAYEDIITDQIGVDGQNFWGYNYKPLQIDITLATDGVEVIQLERLKDWFRPGIERELILSEHGNRAIMARVASVPSYSVLPFENSLTGTLSSYDFTIKTTLYKGEMTISFICDSPFWYSKINMFTASEIADLGADTVATWAYEDGTPFSDSIQTNAFFAGEKYATASGVGTQPLSSMSANSTYYLYYCGSAAAKPIITFTHAINQDNSTKKLYFRQGSNSTLSIDDNVFEYNIPDFISEINRALDKIDDYVAGDSIEELASDMRDNLFHSRVRSRAAAIFEGWRTDSSHTYVDATTGQLKSGFAADFKTKIVSNAEGTSFPNKCILTFNSQNGSALVKYYQGSSMLWEENSGICVKSKYLLLEGKNYFNSSFAITSDECHKVISNDVLENVTISYNYMYI